MTTPTPETVHDKFCMANVGGPCCCVNIRAARVETVEQIAEKLAAREKRAKDGLTADGGYSEGQRDAFDEAEQIVRGG